MITSLNQTETRIQAEDKIEPQYKCRYYGGDSSNKGCFGRKTNLFRESGDFAGNRETWEIFREI